MIIKEQAIFSSFQTTRYQGSKRKLLPWIYQIIKDIPFNSALDGFGGTAAVSYLLKSMGKDVTFNDFLKFNSIIGTSIIENSFIRLSEEEIESILLNTDFGNNIINKTFKDSYYLEFENNWIERILVGINKFKGYNSQDTKYKKAIAFNALFQSCIIKRPFNLFHRNNLYIRTNQVERSFGNKKTWDQDFEVYFKKFIKEINNSIFDSGVICKVENNDIFNLNEKLYDLVYLDPPYVLKNSKNESSNYLNCYHFLEGLSIYESWLENIDFDTKTHRIKNSTFPNYFKASIVNDTFKEIIKKYRQSIIVISYKYGGTPTIESIVNLLQAHGKLVSTYSLPYKYALNRQNGKSQLNREYLIIGK